VDWGALVAAQNKYQATKLLLTSEFRNFLPFLENRECSGPTGMVKKMESYGAVLFLHRVLTHIRILPWTDPHREFFPDPRPDTSLIVVYSLWFFLPTSVLLFHTFFVRKALNLAADIFFNLEGEC
jgi:hypothetical protein